MACRIDPNVFPEGEGTRKVPKPGRLVSTLVLTTRYRRLHGVPSSALREGLAVETRKDFVGLAIKAAEV